MSTDPIVGVPHDANRISAARDRQMSRALKQSPPQGLDNYCLRPYDEREGMTVFDATTEVGRRVSDRTIRNWCLKRGIGRRMMTGPWEISRVALQMVIDDDMPALKAYLAGERQCELVARYYRLVGLGHLLDEWGSSEQAVGVQS